MDGEDAVLQKQNLLLMLVGLQDSVPDALRGPNKIQPGSPAGAWLSDAEALLEKLGQPNTCWNWDVDEEQYGREHAHDVLLKNLDDAIAKLKLDLTLGGHEQIGKAYPAGSYHDFFREVKEIIKSAEKKLFVIDPYFNDDAFKKFLSDVSDIEIWILGDLYLTEVILHAREHEKQHGTTIQVRQSKELHDRLFLVDDKNCWLTGGSVKDGGEKPTFLIPVPQLAEAKLCIYQEIWERADQHYPELPSPPVN